jgi:hypothetical protein
MRGNRFARIARFVLFAVAAALVFSFIVMHLWNWLMPAIFGLHLIGFWQALGLLVLTRILFGGFHRARWGGMRWRGRMMERWAQMSPEEREKFRAAMQSRWGCSPFPQESKASEPSAPQPNAPQAKA